ncbi:hypothetical protein Snoj_48960 [Streptomyces nojiriensis]|uniref:Uncharacterized protein n=1 Tax=Streptomyces nojiriensis TaxID=66374 RepID=A0ABQ3SS67_9ACTN|nr:hypothetical protein GCM10010205_37970 [Streptomyces nojiriensis]GHI70978.1 hypothetical protein Snoj_48960 [Streptomyces nojiriensis]
MSSSTACRAEPSAVRATGAGTVLVMLMPLRRDEKAGHLFRGAYDPGEQATGLYGTDKCTSVELSVR